MSRVIHRLPAVQQVFDLAQSTIYLHVSQGLLPKPIPLGPRAVGWPADEIDQIIEARIAGRTEDEIKELVVSLTVARQALSARANELATQRELVDRKVREAFSKCAVQA